MSRDDFSSLESRWRHRGLFHQSRRPSWNWGRLGLLVLLLVLAVTLLLGYRYPSILLRGLDLLAQWTPDL